MKRNHLLVVFCVLAISGLWACEDDSSNSSDDRCGGVEMPVNSTGCECINDVWTNCSGGTLECPESAKPAGATGCTCNTSTGAWENCTTTGDSKECPESAKPADATGCTCNTSTGAWENCTTTGDKECSEETKPADATGCTCNKSTGEWENCTTTGDKECSEETKPADATGCTCNTSTGEWENCTTTGDKECAEEDKPEGATGCECNTSTGEWENCTAPGENKECAEEDKPEGATGCECNTSTGEWENCTIPGDNKDCAEADKPEGATGCECIEGVWENCTIPEVKCDDDQKPAGVTDCECNQGVWENCTYPELKILTDKDTFTVDEAEKEKADIGVRLSTCPVMPTTVIAETQNPLECVLYVTGDDCTGAKVCYVKSVKLEFNGENCEEFKTFTISGRADNVDDGDAECKIKLTASSDDTDPNTSYDGKTLEITGTNKNIDKAALKANLTATFVKEWADDGTNKGQLKVSLTSRPTANVQINLMADSADYITHLALDKYELEFTPSNFNTPQTVPFSGVRDNMVLDPVDVVIHLMAFSDDTKYNLKAKSFTVKVHNVDEAGVEILNDGKVLSEKKPSDSRTITVKLNSKPSADVEVSLSTLNKRIRFATTNNSGSAQSILTQKIQPGEWKNGKTFYVFPDDDDIANSNNTDKALITTKSTDSNYASGNHSIDYTIEDNDEPPKKLTVSCSGSAGCTTAQGFAHCTFSLDAANRPADKSDVSIDCTSENNVIWVRDSNLKLTNANNYKVTDVDAGGGKCGGAMKGDRVGTGSITCTATNSAGFKAIGGTSLNFYYHHLEWPD